MIPFWLLVLVGRKDMDRNLGLTFFWAKSNDGNGEGSVTYRGWFPDLTPSKLPMVIFTIVLLIGWLPPFQQDRSSFPLTAPSKP